MLKLNSATVNKIATLADKSLRVTLDLRELPPEEMAALFIAYKEGEEGVEIEDLEVKTKSPGQRLYNTIYCVWEQTSQEKPAKQFYEEEMEKIINHFKSKLN